MSKRADNITEALRPCAATDIIIISAMLCGAFFTFSRLETGRPDTVVVFKQNAVIAEYPLNADVVFRVNGQIGPLDIEIKDGTAKILHAGCPRQICKYGVISGSRGQLICAPNNILLQIRSSKTDNDIDAVAY